MKRIITVSLLFIVSFGQAQQTIKTKEITIDPYMQLSHGEFFKMMTLHSKDSLVRYVKGFYFDWGYTYKLNVEVKRNNNVPASDGSAVEYKLLNIISKIKVPDNYKFPMRLERDLLLGQGDQKSTLVAKDDSTYRYMDTIDFIVSPGVKEDFKRVTDKGEDLTGQFEFTKDGDLRLLKLE